MFLATEESYVHPLYHLKVNCGKRDPNMHWDIIHSKVLLAFFSPHSRVFPIKFGKINLRQLVISIVMMVIKAGVLLCSFSGISYSK